jgi:hypothetical protein
MRSLIAFSVTALLVNACSSVPFFSGEIRITADELTQKMSRRFPIEKNVGGLLEVTLVRATVELNAEENRLATSFDLNVKLPLTKKISTGTLKISGRPEYVAESRGLFLRDARVERIRMDNMPDALSAGLAKAATGIAKDVLEEKALYTFKQEDFTKFGIRYEPERIEVRADALALKVK